MVGYYKGMQYTHFIIMEHTKVTELHKPLSRSSNMEESQKANNDDEQQHEKQQTRSNNGRGGTNTTWNKPDLIKQITKPNTKPEQRQPLALAELRKKQLPRFAQVALSQQISLVEQNTAKSQQSHQPQPLQNKSDFDLLIKMKNQQLSKPIYFNVLVAGAAGLGKSSFIDAFLHRKFLEGPVIRQPTTEITYHSGKRTEGDFNFEVCMVDTPGYRVGAEKGYYAMLRKEITDKFKRYREVSEERKVIVEDQELKDDRVHCCLYFIDGPRISKQDGYLMSHLQKYTSIIPILARGDCYTKQQIQLIKQSILQQKRQLGLQWFQCQQVLRSSYPQKLKQLTHGAFGTAPPFIMVSCFKKLTRVGKTIYGRQYSWGVCEVDNPNHCDFVLLYNMLIVFFSRPLIKLTQITQSEYMGWLSERKGRVAVGEGGVAMGEVAVCVGLVTAVGLGLYKLFARN